MKDNLDKKGPPSKHLTTGEIAKYCGVHLRTVIRWIERGELKAYKLPGRGDHRVVAPDFLRFLQAHHMPIPPQFHHHDEKKVLIVDDDKNMALSIERIFKRLRFKTCLAGDGFQAGALLSSYAPHLVTLDLKMPGIDGYEVLNFIRKNADFCRVKILVVSALSEAQMDLALTLGADAALQKPFEQEVFVAKVNHLLGEPLPEKIQEPAVM